MRKFRVKSLSVGGRGNKIFYLNDTVKENNFPPHTVDAHVRDGHLEEIFDETTTVVEAKTETVKTPQTLIQTPVDETPEETIGASKEDSGIKEESKAKAELPEGVLKMYVKDGKSREVKSIDDISKPELIGALKAESKPFSATENKKDLFKKWLTD